MNGRICQLIHCICKEQKIEYCSKHYEESVFTKDAETLATIYSSLKKIIVQLEEIETRHSVNGLGKLLLDDIHALVNIDHDLMNAANKIVREQDENKKS